MPTVAVMKSWDSSYLHVHHFYCSTMYCTGNTLIVVLVLCTLPIQTWSLLMCALVDQMPPRETQQENIPRFSVELAEPSFSEPVLEVSCSTVR